MMLSSQPFPHHRASTLLNPWAQFSSLNVPFFFSNRRRIFPFFKEDPHLYRHTSSRKLQVQDFLENVVTVPSSQNLEKFQKDGEAQTISEFNHLLISLVSADEFELALKLKSDLSSSGLIPDNWTYSILVSFYCKRNEPMEAKIILDHMLEKGFDPNVATMTTLINAFCENGRVRDAFEVFDVMSRIGCQPTINTYNCLLKGLCYVGRVEEAYDLMGRIKKSSMKPDVYTYTAVMDGFCKVGRLGDAFELLNEALERELTPNAVIYNTLLNGFFKEGKPFRAFSLMRRMRERNCSPDCISYSTMLHGLLKWGKIGAALSVYKEMVGIGFRVDERMMNTLLRGLCRWSRDDKELLRDVRSVYEEIRSRNYAIEAGAYELVIEAFCSGGEVDRVFVILNEMVGIGYSPKTFTYNVVIRALSSVGEVDRALVVLKMIHKDRKPQGIPFDALINQLNRQGRLLDARHVYGMALKRGVVPKTKPERTR